MLRIGCTDNIEDMIANALRTARLEERERVIEEAARICDDFGYDVGCNLALAIRKLKEAKQ